MFFGGKEMSRIFVDGHCDTIVKVLEEKEELFENKGHLDIVRLKKLGTALQFFAIWINPNYYEKALRQTLRYIDFYYSQLEKNKIHIGHVNTYEDILCNQKQNKISALLSVEGGEALEGELSSVRMLYRLGVRALTLTWNHRNALGDGIAESQTNGGLTNFGRDVVKEMEQLGMIVDVSHLSAAGFWDVDKITSKPYIASHSNAQTICPAKRNLSDAQIKAIAEKGGIIGINLYPPFLCKQNTACIENILNHIEYIIALVGEDYIGFGGDFDGIDQTPQDAREISHMKKVLEQVELKFGLRIAEKIRGQNFMRVLKELL